MRGIQLVPHTCLMRACQVGWPVNEGVRVVFLAWPATTDGGATKPATPRLAALEAAEQALDLMEGGGLRVWGWGSPVPVPEKKRLSVRSLDG
jgi:hypothetical protein